MTIFLLISYLSSYKTYPKMINNKTIYILIQIFSIIKADSSSVPFSSKKNKSPSFGSEASSDFPCHKSKSVSGSSDMSPINCPDKSKTTDGHCKSAALPNPLRSSDSKSAEKNPHTQDHHSNKNSLKKKPESHKKPDGSKKTPSKKTAPKKTPSKKTVPRKNPSCSSSASNSASGPFCKSKKQQ